MGVRCATGGERHYPEYLKAFNRLRRLVMKQLLMPSVRRNRAGQEHVDNLTRWTAAAVAGSRST